MSPVFDSPDQHKDTAEAKYTDSMKKYVVTYVCILLLAGLQFLLAYQHTTEMGMVARMLFVAIAEAGIAVIFFMHLWAEKRGFLLFVILITGFVFITMQDSWTDSYRIRHGVPDAHINSGVNP